METKLGKSFALTSFETRIDLPTRLVFRVLFDGNARGMSDFGTHTMGASSTRVVRSLQIDGSHNNPPDVSDPLTRRVDKPLSRRGLFVHQKKQSVIPARNRVEVRTVRMPRAQCPLIPESCDAGMTMREEI